MNIDERLLNKILKNLDKLLTEKTKKQQINLKKQYAFIYKDKNLIPVKNFSNINIDTLIGIEKQKQLLLKNTEKFLQGKPANYTVLWGERGTGKSSLIKALLPLYKHKGLRLIQILKEDILSVLELYEFIENKKDYRFIIFIDDLSFEVEEKEYKEFKTIIDGTIYNIPENLLFYITSNKKNLIPIKFSDREKDDYTRYSDVLEEKLSLIDRFGLRLGFYQMDKDTYLKIVQNYAKLYEIDMPLQELNLLAMRYSREMGALNGRVALQFIKSL